MLRPISSHFAALIANLEEPDPIDDADDLPVDDEDEAEDLESLTA